MKNMVEWRQKKETKRERERAVRGRWTEKNGIGVKITGTISIANTCEITFCTFKNQTVYFVWPCLPLAFSPAVYMCSVCCLLNISISFFAFIFIHQSLVWTKHISLAFLVFSLVKLCCYHTFYPYISTPPFAAYYNDVWFFPPSRLARYMYMDRYEDNTQSYCASYCKTTFIPCNVHLNFYFGVVGFKFSNFISYCWDEMKSNDAMGMFVFVANEPPTTQTGRRDALTTRKLLARNGRIDVLVG